MALFEGDESYHRKTAIRLLHQGDVAAKRKRRGRQRCYGAEVVDALRQIWEASDHLCSKRLQPFLGELARVLKQHGELHLSATAEAQLCQMSPATIDRLLRPWRRLGPQHRFSTTKPGTLLKRSIPIRTFSDWQEERPGFLEVDLVAHCGETTEGFYLHTLCCTDVASGWSECIGVWGKDQRRVGAAVHEVRQRLPFSMLGLDSDNGGEFINQHLYSYCQREKITFTRARPYRKNDSCYVEQKNWSMVRRVIGYDRYTSRAALGDLNRAYQVLRLYINFFQPVTKLKSKTRHGARVRKVYYTAKTPYQRLLESGVLSPAKEADLAATYNGLNPMALRRYLDSHLEHLWKLADRAHHHKEPRMDQDQLQ
ncbi:MAG TPA: transposase [Anaerolineae bacterium]|nr:transposase [Anaerolineae bacterium]